MVAGLWVWVGWRLSFVMGLWVSVEWRLSLWVCGCGLRLCWYDVWVGHRPHRTCLFRLSST